MPKVVGMQRRGVAGLAAAMAMAFPLAACSSGGGGDAGTTVPVTGNAAASDTSAASTTTAPPSTTATTLSTEDSVYAAQVALSRRLMEPVKGWRQAWVACLADTAVCDFDGQIGPYVSGPVRDSMKAQVDQLRSSGTKLRDSNPDGVYFVEYSVVQEQPLLANVKVCIEADGVTYRARPDGSEEIVDDSPAYAQLTVLGIREQTTGALTIDQSQELEGDQNIEAENCDQFSELPASQ